VGLPSGHVTPDVGRLLWKHAALTTCLNSTYDDLVEAVRLAAAGELQIPVADVLPLERFREALQALAGNQPVGRLVLAPRGA
jgi:D-arabinose 1-dehydrogenase-like Zn-dependent alcohol dehydrogenase